MQARQFTREQALKRKKAFLQERILDKRRVGAREEEELEGEIVSTGIRKKSRE